MAVIGNYLPRQCGIATFTTDLCSALSAEYGTARLLALPVNDTDEGYDYPARVRWSLAQDDVRSYHEAAEFLNFNNIDMVCLQHEYGIFGGPAGSHILHLLRGLKMPVVTTLHTVLREPNPDQLLVMEENFPHLEPFKNADKIGFQGWLRLDGTRSYQMVVEGSMSRYPQEEPRVYLDPHPEEHHWIRSGDLPYLCYDRDNVWSPARSTAL